MSAVSSFKRSLFYRHGDHICHKTKIFINTVLETTNLIYKSYFSLNEKLIRIYISGKIERNKQWQYVKIILAITVTFSSLRITEAKRHVRNYQRYYRDPNNKISGGEKNWGYSVGNHCLIRQKRCNITQRL
jgi:hypothetical protein